MGVTGRRVGLALRGGLATAVLALAVAAAAGAHDVATPSGHAAEDAVIHSAVDEQRLNQLTLDASKAPAVAAAAATSGSAGDVGRWGPVVDWPVVAINAALLPNGRVLAYDSVGDGATESFPDQTFTRATVWDPNSGGQADVRLDLGYNIFCSGFAHLMDGSVFIAGGNKDQQLDGIVNTTYFNPDTNQWSAGPNMAAGRWYPTVTALNNGEQLITSGGPSVPEVRQNNGTLRSLSTASLSLPLYPWFDVAPSGRAFYSGPDPTLRGLDPRNSGSWQAYQQRDGINRDYGGHALFAIGKELVAGGGPSTTSAEVIDVNGSTPTVSSTAPMAFGRRQHNLTVLADGTVLATGGNSSGASLVDLNAGVYNAELWNPTSGTWRTLAAMQVTRQYHSTALLLPDGRVLSGGGGICGTCDQVGYLAKNAEIFSPPYLFDSAGNPATRPTITSAPSSVTYGQPFQVDTPNAASISKLALVRLGAVTHSVNMEQRYVPLSYTAGTSALSATAPANANIAPPGYYMLFAIDSNGVPSVAKFVRVDPDTTPPAVPSGLNATAGDAQVALNWSANGESDLDHYNVYRNNSKIGSPTGSSYTDTGLTNGTTYSYAVTAVDKAGNESAKSGNISATPQAPPAPPNQPPTVTLTLPANGASYTGPTKIDLAATASDPDGTVSSVSFYNGSSLIATDTTAPYTGSLNVGAEATTLTLTARATDNQGATTTSASVTITATTGGTTVATSGGATSGTSTSGGSTSGGSTSGGSTSGGSTSGGSTSGGSTTEETTTTGITVRPSNAFMVAGVKQFRDGSIQLDLTSLGAGGYQANATFRAKSRSARRARKRKTVTGTFGAAAANANTGAVTLVIHPTRQALAALRRTHRLTVSVTTTFTPIGGDPRTQTRTVSVKKAKTNKKR
jgi:chitodextrinase